MNTILRTVSRFLVAAALALTAPACTGQKIDIGEYPAADDVGVVAEVSKEEATAVANVAMEGMNEGDFAKWTTRWDESMTGAIKEPAFQELRSGFLETYGAFESIVSTRLTEGQDPKNVRFSFLMQHEKGLVVLVHAYPKDGEEIVGVHMREPNGDDLDAE